MINKGDQVLCSHISLESPRPDPTLMEEYNCPHSRFCTVCGLVVVCDQCNPPPSASLPPPEAKLPTPHLLAELDEIIKNKLEQSDWDSKEQSE